MRSTLETSVGILCGGPAVESLEMRGVACFAHRIVRAAPRGDNGQITWHIARVYFTLLSLQTTLYTLHNFTLCTVHFSLYTLHHSTLYTPHSAFYTLLSTLYTPHSILDTLQHSDSKTYALHSTRHTPRLHNPQFTPCTLHSPLNIPLSSHSTLCTPLYATLHSLHWYGERGRMRKTVK